MILDLAIILIIILFYILITPITFEATNVSNGKKKAIVRIKIFPFGFMVLNGKAKTIEKKGSSKPVQKSLKSKKSRGLFSSLFSDLELIKKISIEMIRFGHRLISCPYKYYLELSLKGGLEEPHLTGQLYGVICAVSPILPESIRINYDPDFIDESIRAEYHVGVKFYLAAMFYELLRMFLRLPLIKIVKMIWEYRKENQHAYQN